MTTTNHNPTAASDAAQLPFVAAAAALAAAKSILVVTHINPDGDAIGSLLGLVNALKVRHPDTLIEAAVDGGVPEFLAFLPGADAVLAELTAGRWDVMVSVDASDEARTGDVGAFGRANSTQVINLDHHATNTYFGQIHLVNAAAVSATEVVFDWLEAISQPLNRDCALPLLTGLVTDTIGFRTSNVSARTLGIAQVLMAAGASLTEITARVLDAMSFSALNLWKYVFSSIVLDDGVIMASITQADVARAELTEPSDSGLSGFLIKVNEAMVSAVFKEMANGTVELSFRSKRGFDVSAVALALGGGGHKQASGATVAGTLAEVQAQVLPLLRAAVQNGTLEIV